MLKLTGKAGRLWCLSGAQVYQTRYK